MYHLKVEASPTRILLVTNIFIYIITSIASSSYIQTSQEVMLILGQANYLVLQGHLWQLFTSIFVHANLIHLFGNMIFLMIFGLGAETLYGWRNYYTIYFASGLFGSILSLLLGMNTISVGASGAIFGLFGAVTIYSGKMNLQSILVALIYAVYFFILNIGVNVNVFAHAGGLLVGLVLGYRYSQKLSDENHI
jgi:rhomboid protease GluP|tara:strand:+ start:1759 stop:2337 length:579 start_codon:yes stop_codon:yes gene_type:complete